jgi:LacI family transcriptional regulator, galactose operon repressor
MPTSCPRVALLIETSREYGRALLRGVMRYARLHGPWSFYLTPGDFRQALPEMTQGAGIIARVETVDVAEAILATGLPAVILDPDPLILNKVPKLRDLSVVSSDSEGASRMCAEHFLERGFQNFAFVGLWDRVWSERRRDAFCGAISDAGFQPHVYPLPDKEASFGWEREQSLLARWIEGLPTPVGVMACNDDRGRNVLEACRLAGAHVPEEVAVIGVDNDELFCELSDPPLSSVALNAEHGGYRTAHLLDQLMKGDMRTQQRLIVEPVDIVMRRSTDVKMIEAREVGLVMSFIHRNRSRSFTVNEVADSVGISRRNLEVKFRRATGKTILAEVQRIRLNHAQRMLRETDLPIPQIAEASGYNSSSYLTQVFRKEIGVTPAKYRSKFRI